MISLEEHIQACKFDKYFKKLVKKLKDKKIVVYGSGAMFQLVKNNYDLTELNIIGISDSKYFESEEGDEDLGYQIIPKEKLVDYDFDVFLLAIRNYEDLLYDFSANVFDKTKVKVFPLVKKTFMVLFKEFFDEDFD